MKPETKAERIARHKADDEAVARAARRAGATGLAELSKAVLAAGEKQRAARERETARRSRQLKDCPCHMQHCQEHATGGRLCGVGVCARMN